MSTRDNRLSFRIDKKTDAIVEKFVAEGIVRDRSDFGTQAITHFMQVVDKKPFDTLVLVTALEKLAEKAGIGKEKEFIELSKLGKELRELLDFDTT